MSFTPQQHARLLTDFRSRLSTLAELDISNIENILSDEKFSQEASSKSDYLAWCADCKEKAAELLSYEETDYLALRSWITDSKFATKSVPSCIMIRKSQNFDATVIKLRAVNNSLDCVIRSLQGPRDFGTGTVETLLCNDADEDCRNELNYFVRIGTLMVSDLCFEDSFTGKLEKLALDRQSVFRAEFPGENARVDKAFIAVVAPSMEGKTQSAFSFRKIRPLYFPLSGIEDGSGNEQQIYLNYAHLSKTLIECAKADSYGLPRNTPASELTSRTNKYWTLGFLKKLVENAPRNDDLNVAWMKYFSTQPIFSFSKCSITDLERAARRAGRRSFFLGYCLFLDEFYDEWWNIFLRNISCTIGLSCIVCNTNSKIANLIDRDYSSGADVVNQVWSFAVCKLNQASQSILNEITGFSETKAAILQSNLVSQAIKDFVIGFDDSHIGKLRPGVARFVARAFQRFKEKFIDHDEVTGGDDGLSDVGEEEIKDKDVVAEEEADGQKTKLIDLGTFLNFVCRSLAKQLMRRKPRISRETTAFVAKIGMMYQQAYVSTTAQELVALHSINSDRQLRQLTNQRAYLENHLYYLSNPSNPQKTIFVTFPCMHENRKTLEVFDSDLHKIVWEYELTHLKSTEVFTLLGCLFVRIQKSILQIAKLFLGTIHLPLSIFVAQNENALSNSGDFLEATAVAVIVESSRYAHKSGKFTFKGCDGINFSKNIICHLMENTASSHANLKLTCPPELETFLKKCRIPFLTGENQPPLIASNLSESFFVEQFARGSNRSEIDGKFKFSFDDNLSESLDFVSCEFKNHFNLLSNQKLAASLVKALKPATKAKLSLVIATEFYEEPNIEGFPAFCHDQGINIYRVVHVQFGKFLFRTYSNSGEFTVHPDPKHVCLVFELFKINRQVPPQDDLIFQ